MPDPMTPAEELDESNAKVRELRIKLADAEEAASKALIAAELARIQHVAALRSAMADMAQQLAAIEPVDSPPIAVLEPTPEE